MTLAQICHASARALIVSGLIIVSGLAQAEFTYKRLVPDGSEPNGSSTDVDVSSDGRTVVFSSDATNWASLGFNQFVDRAVAVDLDTGVIEVVSAPPSGPIIRGEKPAVSGNGRHVAFLTYGTTYGEGWQVMRKDRETGGLEIASADAAGFPASGGTNDDTVSISADGRYVAFDTASSNFAPAGSGRQIFVKDMQTGTVEMASVDTSGNPAGTTSNMKMSASTQSDNMPAGGGACRLVPHALSDNGRYLVMTCNTIMVPGATIGQVYLRDLQANTTELISRSASAPMGSTALSYRPAISSNGRFVTFQSRGYGGLGYANGVDSIGNSGVYLRDRQANTTLPIPRPSGIPANEYDSCTTSSVSSIGSVALSCLNSWGGAGRYPQVFEFVPGTGAPTLISVTAGNQAGNNAAGYSLAINASGLSIAWESTASNIDPTDNNGFPDIFVLVDSSLLEDTIFADDFEN